MRWTMVKLMLAVAWVLVFAVLLTGKSPAGDKGISGKELYKQNCRVCHEKGSPHGEYSPLSLIQDQWKNFYKTKLTPTHKEVKLPSQDKKLLDVLTPEQLKMIEKFCVDHAADSEQPQTCS